VATKSPDADVAAPPPKGKKKLLMIVVVLVVLALVAAGGMIYLNKKRNDALLGEDGAHEEVVVVEEPHGPPTYLPLDNMVVNLADPGGERVAQIGVTLELRGMEDTEKVKSYLPSIRSAILILISQRTAEELLRREGKEKLAADILAESSKYFLTPMPAGKADPHAHAKDKPGKGKNGDSPLRGVLFSSFIVQ
jgi:flagellar FliL protein